jgi:FixJ family two-component response regulator
MSGSVWVVDDSAALAESVAAVLESSGIRARAMTSVHEVLGRLDRGGLPRAMVLDLLMPTNGGTVLERLTACTEWTFPVVVLTGRPELLKDEWRGRVAAVVEKAGPPLELVRVLREVMGEEA